MHLKLNAAIFLLSLVNFESLVRAENKRQAANPDVSDVQPGQYEFVASIQKYKYDEWRHFCAGTMISPRKMVTASWCWRDDDIGTDLSLMRVVIRRDIDEEYEHHKRYRIKKWTNKFDLPGKGPKSLDDIAIAELHDDVLFYPGTAVIPYIPIPNMNVGALCFALGWGSLYRSKPRKSILQRANITVLTDTVCLQKFSKSRYTNENFCAQDPPAGFDQFDMGGPVLCPSTTKSLILYGVIAETRDTFGSNKNVGIYVNLMLDKPSKFMTKFGDTKANAHSNELCIHISYFLRSFSILLLVASRLYP